MFYIFLNFVLFQSSGDKKIKKPSCLKFGTEGLDLYFEMAKKFLLYQ